MPSIPARGGLEILRHDEFAPKLDRDSPSAAKPQHRHAAVGLVAEALRRRREAEVFVNLGMDIGVELYRNGNLVSYSGIKTNFGNAHIQNSAAETCHTATYRGKVSPWDVVFPEGYTPPSADGVLWGPTNTINKC